MQEAAAFSSAAHHEPHVSPPALLTARATVAVEARAEHRVVGAAVHARSVPAAQQLAARVLAERVIEARDGGGAIARLAAVADAVRGVEPNARWISAGMTADFAEAIAAGATHLRIGSAITGNRPPRA